ncbi:MAG: hypothetical protein ACKVP7_20210 [Hyphomicrobiaceae bacterium]
MSSPPFATFTKLPSGQWRAQIRKHSHSISRTFRLKAQADSWVREQETRIDKGETPMGDVPASRETFADLAEVGRAFGRSKEATLLRLKDSLGSTRVNHISRDGLVQFAKKRAKEGAGPVTIGIDISFVGTVLEHAAAVHGIVVPTEQVRLARIALNRLGLVSLPAPTSATAALPWRNWISSSPPPTAICASSSPSAA